MKILITGATGSVGPRVVFALHQSGHQVRTFSIDSLAPNPWPIGIEAIEGDIRDPLAVRAAMQGVDAVIHLASLLHIVNPPSTLRTQYERINVGGTSSVIEEARQAGVGRLVFFSTVAVYGASAGGVLTEESTVHPDSFYTQTKVDAERIVLAAKREDGVPLGTVLRLGAVYGSRIKGNYRQLLMALKRGWFLPIGQGLNRRTLIYDKDVANAAILALHHPAAAGRLYNVSDGRYHTLHEIIETMCYALGRKPPLFSLPLTPARRIAGMMEDAANSFGFKSAIVRSTIDKYTEDIAVDSSLIRKDLGFTPTYDLAGGWRDTVHEMRREGQL
jgi:nucleoside-diphosphate-sugar epimerase